MSLPDSATLTVNVRRRRFERRLGVLALPAVTAATILLPLPPLSAALFFVVAAAAVALGLWGQGWLGGAERLTAVSWLSDGHWVLTSTSRQNIPASLSADSRVGTHWMWLRWHTSLGSRSMLLLKGDVLPVEFRRFNVRLRLESVSGEPVQTRFSGT